MYEIVTIWTATNDLGLYLADLAQQRWSYELSMFNSRLHLTNGIWDLIQYCRSILGNCNLVTIRTRSASSIPPSPTPSLWRADHVCGFKIWSWCRPHALGPVSWRPTAVKCRQFSQSIRHSIIVTRQTQYHEALPSSSNVQSHLASSFADDGNASWYSVCRVPMVELWLDCENCRYLTVVGLHDTGPWSRPCSPPTLV